LGTIFPVAGCGGRCENQTIKSEDAKGYGTALSSPRLAGNAAANMARS
jgi:hypothetical protein